MAAHVLNRRIWLAFAGGLLAGIGLCITVIALGVYSSGGLTVVVDLGQVTEATRREIESQVTTLLPVVLEDIKAQVPSRVAGQLAAKLGAARFSIYGVDIRLPSGSLASVRSQIERVVSEELKTSLDTIDIRRSAAMWGEQGEAWVARSLRESLGGRSLALQPLPRWPWLQVPLILHIKTS
ncbi:MAG TPA: hypothetical protein VK008_04895 [Sphingobacteriaceae bacterium]|nr:hypothetical protein [Sphingobacteriaceae bacterium]